MAATAEGHGDDELHMGVAQMPAMEDYWAAGTRYPKIADVMPYRRFKTISRFIHFQDNNVSDPAQDRLYKVSPVLEHVRQNCLKVESVSGMVYDFLPYTGKSTFDAKKCPVKGIGAGVVVQLCSTIDNPSECVVYFDNFFSSLPLIQYLNESMGIRSLGTIRQNRLQECRLEKDKIQEQQGRGSYDFRVDNDAHVAVVKWVDNKAVTLASSCAAISPQKDVKRYSKEERRHITVSCPNMVSQYNVHMGGVDLADMLVALYHTPTKSHRWYLCLFWQMADIAINNGWLLYRRDANSLGMSKHQKLKKFRLEVTEALMCGGAKRGRPSGRSEEDMPDKCIKRPKVPRPIDDIRFDCVDHFPVVTDKGLVRRKEGGLTTILFFPRCLVGRLMMSANLKVDGVGLAVEVDGVGLVVEVEFDGVSLEVVSGPGINAASVLGGPDINAASVLGGPGINAASVLGGPGINAASVLGMNH
ncbi:hypothetical protein ACEWY4_007086 [Coilia grayii]|uniref:PiggyBac transposable element-derived protein domain-containing protein n=1 Tax=Coilia grayii TaxID=363190 RepID=A0ABD1KFK1_9TELE